MKVLRKLPFGHSYSNEVLKRFKSLYVAKTSGRCANIKHMKKIKTLLKTLTKHLEIELKEKEYA